MGRILRTAACLVTGLALAATGALSTIPADAAPRCDVTFTTYHPIKAGSSGAQAKAMECLLHKAGYLTTVDGHFSASDTQELAKFRTSIGLNPLLVVVGAPGAHSCRVARHRICSKVTMAKVSFGCSWRCGRPASRRSRRQLVTAPLLRR
jgi:hypothetical protein